MAKSVTITFLGGLSDIGRNCAVLESDGKMMILDCGVLFANETQPGIDNILPDLDYIYDRADSVVGCVLTHAHEDHIGALKHLFEKVKCPLYGSPFTLGLASRRLAESGFEPELIEVVAGESINIGPFECEFLPVTHSIPGGHITAVKTPQGVILHSSDFKLDEAPIDNRLTDIDRIKELSKTSGIRLLLADSTNSDQEGISASESSVQEGIQKVFGENQGRRIFVACFSSHIHRVQQIVNVAKQENRKIAVMGMSMRLNINLARQLKILEMEDYLDIEDIDGVPDGELCIISTGSQAEENSALAKAASGSNRWISVGPNDTIVLSANPIPGNEARVYRMMNDFVSWGTKVAQGTSLGLHTTGHGKRGELQILHTAANPEWFVPVHGEWRHLESHKELAVSLGMAEERVLLCLDGDQVEMTDDGVNFHQSVSSGRYLFSQGNFVSYGKDIFNVFSDRKNLANYGAVQIGFSISKNKMTSPAFIDSRGFMDGENATKIHSQLAGVIKAGVETALRSKKAIKTPEMLEKNIKKIARKEIKRLTGRFPLIFIHISWNKSR